MNKLTLPFFARRLLAVSALAAAVVSPAAAGDIYIAQNLLGTGSGADANDAKPASFFNSPGNWGTAAGLIGPGVTVHLVGTLTTALATQGSGGPGQPIVVLFEPGAAMVSPAWSANGAISTSGGTKYITIDGGADGVIENTANGAGLSNQVDSVGIRIVESSFVTVKNLTIRDMYVRSSGTDPNQYGTCVETRWNGGTNAYGNILVSNCVFHDAAIGFNIDYGPNCANFEYAYCEVYNCNWCGNAGDHGSTSSLSGLLVHDNQFYGWTNWNSPSDQFHHNGFYGWAESGGTLRDASVYNNLVGPGFDPTDSSAGVFFSGDIGGILAYNNLFVESGPSDSPADGLIFIWKHGTGNGDLSGSGFRVYSNTFIGGGSGTAICFYDGIGSASTVYDAKNNLATGVSTFISVFDNADNSLISDFNLGYNLNPQEQYSISSNSSGNFFTFAQWQAKGFDPHGLSGNPVLGSDHAPQSGSPAIAAGANLSAFFATDADGFTRPSTAAWDIGAFQFDPGSLSFTSQPASQTVAAGSNVSFVVAAAGNPAPVYQWRKNGVNIAGATSATLSFANVATSDAAIYTAAASNSSGSITSNGATLAVVSPPVFSSQPASQTVNAGANVAMAAGASGTPTPTLQWRKNGVTLSDGGNVTGSASSVLLLASVASGDAASYTVLATNSAGSTLSKAATLAVLSIPTPPLPFPVVTSALGASGTVGSSFQYTIAATNSPTRFTATGIPGGLSLNTGTGLISGVPTGAGTYAVSIGAVNAGGSGTAQLSISIGASAAPGLGYVQGSYSTPQSSVASVSVAYPASQTSGNMNIVVIGWSSSSTPVSSVTDTKGNLYTLAAGPTVLGGFGTQCIYYSSRISGAGAGANAVTVKFRSAVAYPDIRVLEYRGVTSVDSTAAATGTSAMCSSGSLASSGKDLLVAANYVATTTNAAGAGFTSRMITRPDADIVEDWFTAGSGHYTATAPIGPSGHWIMQMVAFH